MKILILFLTISTNAFCYSEILIKYPNKEQRLFKLNADTQRTIIPVMKGYECKALHGAYAHSANKKQLDTIAGIACQGGKSGFSVEAICEHGKFSTVSQIISDENGLAEINISCGTGFVSAMPYWPEI